MATVTHGCSVCNHTGRVPDTIFGGWMPCQCQDVPASVGPDRTAEDELSERVAWTDLVVLDEAAAAA